MQSKQKAALRPRVGWLGLVVRSGVAQVGTAGASRPPGRTRSVGTLSRLASVLATVFVLLALTSGNAAAQEGFSLNRYTPAEQGSDWFANDSLDFRGSGRLAVGGVLDFSLKPLVIYDGDGDEVAAVVEQQFYLHAGLAVNLFDRLRLAGNLPILLLNTGETADFNGETLEIEEGAGLGDAHLSADLRLFGTYGGPLSLAVGAQLFLPTGTQDAYSGDGSIRFRPRLMAAGDLGPIAYAAGASYTLGRDGDFAGDPFGDELGLNGALGIRLVDKRLLLGGEVFGSTVLSDGGAFDRRTTPFEVVFGGKYRVSDAWQIGAAVGPGLTRGVGSPEVRGLLAVTWFPRPEIDRDGDGIVDSEDACPDVAGEPNADDLSQHGCPAAEPQDRDQDGIVDAEDACPDEAGEANSDASRHGCPPPSDRDEDGILDEDDACPDEPGIESSNEEYHGCPDPDSDKDGILVPDDACPEEAGVVDPNPQKHGCPKAKVVQGRIEILERVKFATNESTIEEASYPVLRSVLQILKAYQGIELVSVEGHTDNRGRRGYNQGLSQRRAEAVVLWLVERGVDSSRLRAEGFGPDRPIETNSTEEGRRNNRRVEFHIKRGGPGGETQIENAE